MEHNKLVRDKIPDIIRDSGDMPVARTLSPEEYKVELLKKLVEEAKELLDDPGIEERADIAEVLLAIDKLYGFTPTQIEDARVRKVEVRGGFEGRIFLESTTRPE